MSVTRRPPADAIEVTQTFAVDHTNRPGPEMAVPAPGLPAIFGRYQIERQLGSGSMGVVYLALDSQLVRKVALKVPNLPASNQSPWLDRFYREARTAATLRHPNICPVYDVGQIDGRHFISMAYIEGKTLSQFIRPEFPQEPRKIAVIVRKLALGLEEAHRHGVIHRDLKPSNIMVDARGEPIVTDFGLARAFDQEDQARVTQSGMIVGTARLHVS